MRFGGMKGEGRLGLGQVSHQGSEASKDLRRSLGV